MVQFAANSLVWKDLLPLLAVHRQVVVVRDPLKRRPYDAFANLLGREQLLGVNNDSVVNLLLYILGLISTKSKIGLPIVSSYK